MEGLLPTELVLSCSVKRSVGLVSAAALSSSVFAGESTRNRLQLRDGFISA